MWDLDYLEMWLPLTVLTSQQKLVVKSENGEFEFSPSSQVGSCLQTHDWPFDVVRGPTEILVISFMDNQAN